MIGTTNDYTQLESRFERRVFSPPLYGTVILRDIFNASGNNGTYSRRPKTTQTRENGHLTPVGGGGLGLQLWAQLQGCMTCSKINTKRDVLIDVNN